MRAFHENRSYGKGLPVQIDRVRNISFLAHWHHDLEFIYVTHGSLQVGINSETRILHAGDFAFCGSGDIHYYEHAKSGAKRLDSEIIMIIFNPRLIGSPAGWPPEQSFRFNFIPYSGTVAASEREQEALQQLAPVMTQLAEEAEQQRVQSDTIMIGLLHILSGLALRYVPADASALRQKTSSAAHLKIMQELLDQLERKYKEPLTLQDGADYARMSVFHFSRFFKNVTGMGYNTYVNELRVRHAEQLIRETNQKMIDIALDCGFGNIRTFNRVFRQLRGCRPSDLR